jgi:hypothetical protein
VSKVHGNSTATTDLTSPFLNIQLVPCNLVFRRTGVSVCINPPPGRFHHRFRPTLKVCNASDDISTQRIIKNVVVKNLDVCTFEFDAVSVVIHLTCRPQFPVGCQWAIKAVEAGVPFQIMITLHNIICQSAVQYFN